MLSGSRDVVCVSLCVSLSECVGVLTEATPDTQADFFFFLLKIICEEFKTQRDIWS